MGFSLFLLQYRRIVPAISDIYYLLVEQTKRRVLDFVVEVEWVALAEAG